MIELRPTIEGLDRIARDLNATPKQVDRALSTTVARTAAWLRRKSAQKLSADLQVSLDVLRYRMRTLRRGGNGARVAALWYGLNGIALTHLNPRELRQGVSAGPVYARKAFIAKGQVFRRKPGVSRLPVERVEYQIKDKAEKTLEGIIDGADFQSRFLRNFERELTRIWTRAAT